jgi:hypothetical protein
MLHLPSSRGTNLVITTHNLAKYTPCYSGMLLLDAVALCGACNGHSYIMCTHRWQCIANRICIPDATASTTLTTSRRQQEHSSSSNNSNMHNRMEVHQPPCVLVQYKKTTASLQVLEISLITEPLLIHVTSLHNGFLLPVGSSILLLALHGAELGTHPLT